MTPTEKAIRGFCGRHADWWPSTTQVQEMLALAQPEQDNTYIYASSLATAIWQKHYMKESPKFALFDTTEGVLTQIDNMTCGLVREKPAQPEQEPVAWWNDTGTHIDLNVSGRGTPLYTTPPQRKLNERIKELAKAHLVREEHTEFGWQECHQYSFDEDELTEFAELIVQECIDWIDGSPTTEEGSLILSKHFIIANLKQHFGVEE